MIEFILIAIIVLFVFVISKSGPSKDIKTTSNKSHSYKELTIKKGNYKKEFSFHVTGGDFREYLYPIYNIIKLNSVVTLTPEPTNKFDGDAIQVKCSDWEIGYVPSYDTSEVKEIIKNDYIAYIENLSKEGYISIAIKILYND